jgi:hypothetical protein
VRVLQTEYNRGGSSIEKGEAGSGDDGRAGKEARTGDNGHLPVEAQSVGHL